MKQGIVLSAALLAAVTVGCKGKGDKAKGGDPTPAPGTGSAVAATPDAAAAPAPDAAAPTPPPAGATAAKVEAGKETPRGCIGWASKLHAAACVTGTMTNGEPDLQVAFVGSTTAAIAVAASLGDDDAAKINAALATDGYVAPSGAATPLVSGTPLTLGAATLTFTSKETAKGGDNVAPTTAVTLTAVCGGKDVELLKAEREGVTPTVTVRSLDDRLLIEVTLQIAREGEQGSEHGVAVLDPATCAAATEGL
ncbi:MAG: hypothetical protein JNK64_09445 [Myxococcales bacterium]|nr:hypothetical protein [Myxococcales bacterium]